MRTEPSKPAAPRSTSTAATRVDLFFEAWKVAGFRAVGHLLFRKRDASSGTSCATSTSRPTYWPGGCRYPTAAWPMNQRPSSPVRSAGELPPDSCVPRKPPASSAFRCAPLTSTAPAVPAPSTARSAAASCKPPIRRPAISDGSWLTSTWWCRSRAATAAIHPGIAGVSRGPVPRRARVASVPAALRRCPDQCQPLLLPTRKRRRVGAESLSRPTGANSRPVSSRTWRSSAWSRLPRTVMFRNSA